MKVGVELPCWCTLSRRSEFGSSILWKLFSSISPSHTCSPMATKQFGFPLQFLLPVLIRGWIDLQEHFISDWPVLHTCTLTGRWSNMLFETTVWKKKNRQNRKSRSPIKRKHACILNDAPLFKCHDSSDLTNDSRLCEKRKLNIQIKLCKKEQCLNWSFMHSVLSHSYSPFIV